MVTSDIGPNIKFYLQFYVIMSCLKYNQQLIWMMLKIKLNFNLKSNNFFLLLSLEIVTINNNMCFSFQGRQIGQADHKIEGFQVYNTTGMMWNDFDI